ncbi:predicted protein [Streptomyces sp. AA4]|nr:predicted protein [Streptomyces sp. AA4]
MPKNPPKNPAGNLRAGENLGVPRSSPTTRGLRLNNRDAGWRERSGPERVEGVRAARDRLSRRGFRWWGHNGGHEHRSR